VKSGVPLLAYVFWHRPASASPVYEADLLAFHASLAAAPPSGFVRSEAFGLSGASWLAGDIECFEDWYLVSDWSAIGGLNRDAVGALHAASHDRVAHQADSGAGAIYGLHAGTDSPGYRVGTWFAKPPGCSYDSLDAALARMLDAGGSLWRRQMVLGPAPEFCLRTPTPQTLPDVLSGERIDYLPLP
jgi:hypothetical protein